MSVYGDIRGRSHPASAPRHSSPKPPLPALSDFVRGCFASLLCFGLLFHSVAASADSLTDALGHAYAANPDLQAERAKLRAIDEQISQALAKMRPTLNVTASAQKQRSVDHTNGDYGYGLNTKTTSVEVTQPIYKGGSIQSDISGAQNRILAERAILLSTEQTTLLAAASAYMDVLRDQMTLEQINNYQRTLQTQYEIQKRRLLIGENTKTDVSQAEARLAQAMSDRLQYEATLRASSSNYARIIGSDPFNLANPKISLSIPANIDDIVELARTSNPDVIAARYQELSARNDVESIDGGLLPSVDAVGNVSRSWNPSTTQTMLDSASIMLRMTVPLDNGSVASRARGARQTVSQMMMQTESAQRKAVDMALRSWNFLMAVRSQIRAGEAAIRAVNETLMSLRTEVNVGSRTVTDLLNAEQEALSSRLGLINSKHDEVVWSFTLLSSIGRLTAQNINLSVDYYDYAKHYDEIRGKLWGVSLGKDPK